MFANFKAIQLNPALFGFLLAVPFLVINFIVAVRPEPVYSLLGSIGFISASPLPLVPVLVFLGLLGSYVAVRPLFRKNTDGTRTFYIVNVVLALVLFAFFAVVGSVLGEEIYRCDILHIPNCD